MRLHEATIGNQSSINKNLFVEHFEALEIQRILRILERCHVDLSVGFTL
jgi:hypothetical protein